MWNLRNLTEDHGEGKGKNSYKQRGWQTIINGILLNAENKLKVDVGGGWREGKMGDGH